MSTLWGGGRGVNVMTITTVAFIVKVHYTNLLCLYGNGYLMLPIMIVVLSLLATVNNKGEKV